MTTCKLCEHRTDFVQAHIIPAGFFRRINDGSGTPVLLDQRQHPKRAPIGAYDSAILCRECEPVFGAWDTYAQEVLADLPPGTPRLERGRCIGYEIEAGSWKYEPLKLFLVSLAWRASVSQHEFYRRIRLRPFELVARRMILARQAGAPQEFSAFLAVFTGHLGKTFLNPHHQRIDGVNFVMFYLAGYVAYIKVDRRATPEWANAFILTPGAPLRILSRDFASSKEFAAAKDLATRPQNLAKQRRNGSINPTAG